MKFCSKFFTSISNHFCAYFMFNWPSHSDLGITGKIFSFCRTLINFDQRRWRQRGNQGQCSSWVVTGGTGVDGLRLTTELTCHIHEISLNTYNMVVLIYYSLTEKSSRQTLYAKHKSHDRCLPMKTVKIYWLWWNLRQQSQKGSGQ